MTENEFTKPRMTIPGNVKRKSLRASESLVAIEPLYAENTLPLLIRPVLSEVDLLSWSASNRALIEKHLLKHGAILFRGFGLHTADDFARFITGVAGSPLEYHERSSPRSQVHGNVYTSTDHPASQSIFLHNENSYQQTWPLRIFFCGKLAAHEGGETPIADVRRVYSRISPAIRESFRQKQVMYVRNFGDGFGLPWQTVFQTTDKKAVEAY